MIAAYIDHYHDRPHSRLDYRTPREVPPLGTTPKEHYKNSGLNRQRQAGALHPAAVWVFAWGQIGTGDRALLLGGRRV